MNIGVFNKVATTGALVGSLPSLNFKDVVFEAIEQQGNGPAYRITLEGAELGAAWKKTSAKGTNYLSAQIDTPALIGPVYFAVFEKNGRHVAVWDRKPEQDQA